MLSNSTNCHSQTHPTPTKHPSSINPPQPITTKEHQTDVNDITPCPTTDIPEGSPFRYIESAQDISSFVFAIKELANEKNLLLSTNAMRLLWILAIWLAQETRMADMTMDAVKKLVDICHPMSDKEMPNPFDIIMGDCADLYKRKIYADLRRRVYGIHSSYYKIIWNECVAAVNALPENAIVKRLQSLRTDDERQKELEDDFQLALYKDWQLTNERKQELAQYRKITAIHEAGHAIAAIVLSMELSGVSIEPLPKTKTWDSMGRSEMVKSPEDPFVHAKIRFAGAAAEKILLGRDEHGGCGSDFKRATEDIKNGVIAKLTNPGDSAQFACFDADQLGLAENESPYIIYETIKKGLELKEATEKLIAENRHLVQALANELLEKENMPGEEVKEFLDKVSMAADK